MKLHRFSKSGKLLYTIEKETEMSDKILLPEELAEIRARHNYFKTTWSEIWSQNQAAADRDRLLQALETALGKVEQLTEVKEGLDFIYSKTRKERDEALSKLNRAKECIEELAEALELTRAAESNPTEGSHLKADNYNLPGFHELRSARQTLKELEE